jgi:hypothetical protein
VSRFNFVLLLILAVLAWAQPTLAATYYVGTCKSGSYASISAAVSAVPTGSTVMVCPGSYSEQVIISKALTLEGMTSNNSNQPIITAPSTGLTRTTTVIFVNPVAPQVWVTANNVNITNVTVDGTGASICDSAHTLLIGVFYASGSSGIANQVTTRNQNNCGYGYGIWAENGSGNSESATIENCSIHNFDNAGIYAAASTGNTLTATIRGNNVYGADGIILIGATSTVTDNVTNGGYLGIYAGGPSSTITGNTVMNTTGNGIEIFSDGVTVKTNKILNTTGYAISLGDITGETIEDNTITNAATAIEMTCLNADFQGNTITDATTGLDEVPTGFTLKNTFFNVGTINNSLACEP